MRDLWRRSFDLWVKMRWLKEIDKAADRYNKTKDKLERERHVVNALLNVYKEKYGEDLRSGFNGK